MDFGGSKLTWIDVIKFNNFCAEKTSNAQLRQDLLALYFSDSKRDGFFVEFGACDGENLSNTLLLEKEYGWDGILAEPGRNWQEDLKKNRSCSIETLCVYSSSGITLNFAESEHPVVSTIEGFINSDYQSVYRQNNTMYSVNTISLDDLLKKYDAPKDIDFISIDVEGAEYEILSTFSFDWNVKLFTIEHNHNSQRDNIYNLMVSHGYTRVFQEISEWDDWYVMI